MKVLAAFIVALPELLKLVAQIQEAIKEAGIRKKVRDGVRELNQAFKDKDAEAIRRILNP